MQVTIVNPDALYNPSSNGYSHAAIADGAGLLAFIAGQGGEKPDGALSCNFADQVQQAFANLRTAIEAVGGTPANVVKLATYVVDHNEDKLLIMTCEIQRVFGGHLPAQTLVPVPRLALDGMLFEVDAILALPGPPNGRED